LKELNMRVLGISPLDKDSTVSFVEDGRILFAAGEERFSRMKLQDGFPHQALAAGLRHTGWEPSSIDAVGYAFFDGDGEARLIREAVKRDTRAHRSDCTAPALARLAERLAAGYRVDRTVRIPGIDTPEREFMPKKGRLKSWAYRFVARHPFLDWQAHRYYFKGWVHEAIADHRRRTAQLHAGLGAHGLEGKLRRFSHHDTHAANAFHASGFSEALVVTLDGYGSGNCGGVYVGNERGLRPLQKFSFPNSLGQFYEHVTSALGFKPNRHEGKIVGLAAYGDPGILRDVLRARFEVKDGDLAIRASLNYLFPRFLAEHFSKRDIAAAYQSVLEDVAREVVAYWLKKTGLRKLAMSGGVNANVKLNQRLREIEGVDSVFIYPNMGDGGCGTGAAMLVLGGDPCPRSPLPDVYLGPSYSDVQMESVIRQAGLSFGRLPAIEEKVAELLAADCIVARFAGRMEYGPRALGNRSILYPAKEPEVNQWLNHQLGRTEFMPFAPVALASEAPRLFKRLEGCEKTAEFMTMTFDCTPQMIRACPAAVHVDGTARPQLVSEATNRSFHRILRAYHERTGIPAVINTSFNMHEEPIVCSPEDALRAFLLGNIDYLAMGDFLIPHPRLKENLRSRQLEAAGV
jgi:carbamoyltransferase